ncbi:MAG: N-acetylmuramoyl-L-alanine amidase [Bacteroidales bacterium]
MVIKKRILPLFLIYGFLIFFPSILTGQENEKPSIKTVVIDAGHGGKDPGALGKHSKEKDIVLAISLKVGKYIEEYLPGINVIYTRKSDVFVPLHERADIANRNKADLFISIHANGYTKSEIFGTETFVMGQHTNERHLEVAKKENSVIVLEDDYTTRYEGFDPNSSESYIIFNLLQRTYLEQSLNFASYIQNQFRERVRRHDRGVQQAGLLVLWKTTMPSVLVEVGFITNPQEEKYLNSELGQDYLASAIFRAFRDYKYAVESRSDFFSHDSRDDEETIAINNIEYRIQIAASSTLHTGESDLFIIAREADPEIDVEFIKSGNLYKYTLGKFTNYQETLDYSREIKKTFPDAFIVAVKDGKIIPVSAALKLSSKN